MTIRRTLGALTLGLALLTLMPAASEAAHRHSRRCGHSSYVEYYDRDYRPYYQGRAANSYDRYDRYDRYDDVDYDAPYVARHGSGRYSDRYYYDDYGYRGYGRPRVYVAP